MDLKIAKNDLLKALGRVLPAVGKDKSPVAILSCALIRADKDGSVFIGGTDTFSSISVTTTATVKKPGAVAVKAHAMFDACKNAPSGDLSVAVSKDGSRISVKAGKWERKMGFITGDDFPPITGAETGAPTLEMPSSELARILGQVSYAMAQDESREAVACARLEFRAGVTRAIAIDSCGMAMAEAACGSGDFVSDQIARRFVADVKKLADEFSDESVVITGSRMPHGGGFLHFAWPGVAMTTKRSVDGFPSYSKLIPQSFVREWTCPREDLIAAVKRAMLASDDEGAIDLEVSEGVMTARCQSSANGESADHIDVAYAGEKWSTRAGGAWAVSALSSITDDEVRISSNGPLEPFIVVGSTDPGSCMALLMPRRA